MDYLSAWEADYRRLLEVSHGRLGAQVPSCPEWNMQDLVEHVAMVYLHKVECMRQQRAPQPWPPDMSGVDPEQFLHEAHASLSGEFTTRALDSPAHTWYGPDQTVGFWARRMAQETVIHRIDAELAAGEPSVTVPDDLAIDGVDEALRAFLLYGTQMWPGEFAEVLGPTGGLRVGVNAGDQRWVVISDGARIEVASGADAADAEVSGAPDAMLRWIWRRDIPLPGAGISMTGDERRVAQLRELMGAATG